MKRKGDELPSDRPQRRSRRQSVRPDRFVPGGGSMEIPIAQRARNIRRRQRQQEQEQERRVRRRQQPQTQTVIVPAGQINVVGGNLEMITRNWPRDPEASRTLGLAMYALKGQERDVILRSIINVIPINRLQLPLRRSTVHSFGDVRFFVQRRTNIGSVTHSIKYITSDIIINAVNRISSNAPVLISEQSLITDVVVGDFYIQSQNNQVVFLNIFIQSPPILLDPYVYTQYISLFTRYLPIGSQFTVTFVLGDDEGVRRAVYSNPVMYTRRKLQTLQSRFKIKVSLPVITVVQGPQMNRNLIKALFKLVSDQLPRFQNYSRALSDNVELDFIDGVFLNNIKKVAISVRPSIKDPPELFTELKRSVDDDVRRGIIN